MAKILVVDDYPPNRELLATLIAYDGHEALLAADGAEALDIVRAEHPRLVICDILMPTMDGYEFVRHLRADPRLADIDVMFHTANYREREARTLADSLGVSRILMKPCPPEQIIEAIDDALAENARAEPVLVDDTFDRAHLRLVTDKLAAKAAELEHANQRLAALTELNIKLSAERDTRALLDKVCQGARELTGARYAILCIEGPNNGRTMIVLGCGPGNGEPASLQCISRDGGLFAKVISDRRPLRFSNPDGRPEGVGLPADFPTVHCGVAAPIASTLAVYGWVCLINKVGAREFTEEDEWISGAHAAQAGHIYENWSLYGQLERRAAELAGEIATRKVAEQQLRRVLRARKVMAECNRALVRAQDEAQLLRDMCQFVVGLGGYAVAWVGLARPDQGCAIEPVAVAGDDGGLPRRLLQSWSGHECSGCPVALAVRRGTPQVVHDIAASRALAGWHEEAQRRGLRALAALPLECDGETLGVLCIVATDADAFDADELELLVELADDIAYGVHTLRVRVQRQQMEATLRLRNRALDESINAILISEARGDADNPVIYANPAFTLMTGYPAEEVLGRNPRFLLGDDWDQPDIERLREAVRRGGDARVTLRNYRRDGSLFWNEVSLASMRDGRGRVSHFISIFNDLTDRKRYEEELEQQANHDALTGLANRNLLHDRLQRAMIRARRDARSVGVMLLDLDRFKFVNDSLGHYAGDCLLREVARRLVTSVREDDTVARLGGDEFMIVVGDIGCEKDSATLAAKVLESLVEPISLDGREILVTGSIGVALFPQDAEHADNLLKHADVAMYRAKELGRNRFQFYAPEMNAQAVERLEMENALRRALDNDEFELHYQPKVCFADGSLVGAEALIRWNHPTLGAVPPTRFIPLAEDNGLIVPIGEWVIRSACAQLARWREGGIADISVAVNVSARQFQQQDLVQILESALSAAGVPPHLLHVEVTESAVMRNPEATIHTLARMRELGVRISLDDFGTGYSSLNYLKRFPIDSVKIDQSFVADIPHSREDAAIALMVISLAHSLGQTVIAEGVANDAQRDFLRNNGCDEGQGNLFSMAVPAQVFENRARGWEGG